MNMRLVTPPPSNKLLTSNQALFTKGSKKGLTTVTKIPKTKGKFRDHPYKKVLSRGHSFVYIGDGEEREPNPSAAIDPSPPKPNGTLGGTKTKSIKLYSPAAKAGRSDTAAAMGVNAVSHAVANNAKLPKDVKPAKSRRWEWLHLIGDAVGGPTVPGNLACGTYDGNTQHNTIEEAVIEASQQATATDPLEYTVKATLITGTAIAKKFECKADLPSGRQITWEPVDTLRISKLDTVEDALRRYQAQRNI